MTALHSLERSSNSNYDPTGFLVAVGPDCIIRAHYCRCGKTVYYSTLQGDSMENPYSDRVPRQFFFGPEAANQALINRLKAFSTFVESREPSLPEPSLAEDAIASR